MNVNKKLGRFKQWAGERMGGEVKTNVSEDFKSLEIEMGLRQEGIHIPLTTHEDCDLWLKNSRHGTSPKVDDRLCQDALQTPGRRRQGKDTPNRLPGLYHDQPRGRL